MFGKRRWLSRRFYWFFVPVFSMLVSAVGLSLATAPTVEAACTALPTTYGNATFTVSVPSTGTYRFWAHIYSPSTNNNGVYLQVDDALCQIKVGDSNSIPVGQFTWVDYQNGTASSKINVNLSAGNHTVKMAGLDPGVGVDKVMFLADTNCVPTGAGDNCVASATPTSGGSGGGSTGPTPSPTVVVTPVPGATSSNNTATPVSGTIELPKASKPGTTRTYYIDGQRITSDKLDTTTLPDGNHTLKIVETDANGKTTITAQKLMVDNIQSWGAIVLGWLHHPLNIAIVVGSVLLLAGGGFVLWRFKYRNGLPKLANWPSVKPSVKPAVPSPVTPPPPSVVYPDKPDPRL